jgi:membrane protease YdiL (CAAX protease family)
MAWAHRLSASRAGTPSRAAALIEIIAMLALLLSYIWLWRDLFVGDYLLVVVLYFALCHISHLRCGESARSLGLRLDNWRSAARQACVPVIVGMGVPLAAGAALGSWHFKLDRLVFDVPWHVVWGTAQQYGLLCLLYRRSLDVLGTWQQAALAAASAFAVVHLPNPLLVGVTFLAGFVACTLYRRVPNVFVLGVAHAMISLVLFFALPLSITHNLRVGPSYFTAPTELRHGS